MSNLAFKANALFSTDYEQKLVKWWAEDDSKNKAAAGYIAERHDELASNMFRSFWLLGAAAVASTALPAIATVAIPAAGAATAFTLLTQGRKALVLKPVVDFMTADSVVARQEKTRNPEGLALAVQEKRALANKLAERGLSIPTAYSCRHSALVCAG